MAGGVKKQEVLKVTDSSMSPEDLEAEIAASASAISGYETVAGKTIETPDKPKPKKKTTKKPEKTAKKSTPKKKTLAKTTTKPKKPTQKKGKVMATSDVKPAPKPIKKPPTVAKIVSDDSESKPSAVKITIKTSSSTPAKPSSSQNTKNQILNHQGRTLQPIGSSTQATTPTAKPRESKTGVATPVAIKSEVQLSKKPQVVASDKPYAVLKAATEVSESTEHQPHRAGTGAGHRHSDAPHVARIYDTKTYHIPLSVDHHHRKAMMPRWAQYVVLAIGIAALVVTYLIGQ